ncbi:hypothetical protein Sjap_004000 [Stephania japonica]|uniref:Beta-amylase n=1 Tax=Stephania japonica TaxID=461633 RepID=A0AAP0PHE2_9MAGN
MNKNNSLKQDVEPQSDHSSEQAQTQRRPRGFANRGGGVSGGGEEGKGKKEREREKERTKLRERHRRAITSRMLAGLRQYGNFTLPARADMNDVLAALAREAGWTVDSDGTTYRSSPPPPPPHHHPHHPTSPYPARSMETPLPGAPMKGCTLKGSLDCQPSSVLRIDGNLSPASLDSVVVADRDSKSPSPMNSSDCIEADQDGHGSILPTTICFKECMSTVNCECVLNADGCLHLMGEIHHGEHGTGFIGSPYVPVYVSLPSGVINSFCQLIDSQGIRHDLRHLKSLSVDGVVVDCWWGIVEGWSPQKYMWSGYRDLFNIILSAHLQNPPVKVVMSFHECGGNGPGEIPISLPKWVMEIGKDNQDIFFTDREGRRNTECLSWGIDKERVLKGRTGTEVYFDLMRSFRMHFDDLFAEGLISAVEIGLGPSGELKYPSFAERMGWRYPGIGEFQCYDKYLQQSIRKAAKQRGHSFWARGPDNAGNYNSRPHETGFFCERGDYDSYYGRFFLHWYSQTLLDHANNVLSLASLAFEDTKMIVKIPAVYWWYKTPSHAAELTAGFYNPTNQDGYSTIFQVLKKYSATLKFVCLGLPFSTQENDSALSDSEGLVWQVQNSAWDHGLDIAGQNIQPCFDKEDYSRIVEATKPRNDPDRRYFSFFVYQQPSPLVQREIGFSELDSFIKSMHGLIGQNDFAKFLVVGAGPCISRIVH